MSVLTAFVDNLLAAGATSAPFAVGTVLSASPGGAVDGSPLVTVSWRGTSVAVPYAESYAPGVGDVVLMARIGPQLVILCRIVGTPA